MALLLVCLCVSHPYICTSRIKLRGLVVGKVTGSSYMDQRLTAFDLDVFGKVNRVTMHSLWKKYLGEK